MQISFRALSFLSKCLALSCCELITPSILRSEEIKIFSLPENVKIFWKWKVIQGRNVVKIDHEVELSFKFEKSSFPFTENPLSVYQPDGYLSKYRA